VPRCRMDWARDLTTWSHPSLSRRVALGRHVWHVQEAGDGPTILLLHGAGASVHTWRDLIPDLALDHHVIALDLPGQGFSIAQNARMGLDEMAQDIDALLIAEQREPSIVLCHSAGAAIALRLAQMRPLKQIIGINPALDHFEGVAGWLFPVLAKLLAINPLTASLFTFGASPARAEKLIKGTGSKLTPEGLRFYTRLMRDKPHVNGTLQMMARWRLDQLLADLPSIDTKVLFLIGGKDSAVPPKVADQSAARLQNARVERFDDLGHLAQEEAPQRLLKSIRKALVV